MIEQFLLGKFLASDKFYRFKYDIWHKQLQICVHTCVMYRNDKWINEKQINREKNKQCSKKDALVIPFWLLFSVHIAEEHFN